MLKCNLQYVFSDDKGGDQGVDIDAVFILYSNSITDLKVQRLNQVN